ncbi:MarR family winged helix-turn-helix transcriptional regulator [Flavisolibacter tropicus]|uniref:Transcriptional regulator n=1 Tax=Flavisolibacter tropicus TaxID=1492898 RepID=A0A172TX31_9BACT|nr:MarR family transcriptional regulator [Flavisolibacter tropicus]ANE51671.1 transcriptional regulator [Flavisolibacter tropicus]
MGIEKDIHQARFNTSRQKAMVNVLYSYGWLVERIKTILAAEDITHQQYNILRILRGSAPEPISTLQIRERMLDKMSDTSRIVDRLIIKGLVKKTVCVKDKRLVDVIITDKGQKLLKKLDQEAKNWDDIINLSESESEQLSHLLDKMRQAD